MADYSIKAILSAVDQGFTNGLNKAQSSLDNFSSKSHATSQTVGKVMTATGGAITAMGIKSVTSFGKFQQSLNTAAIVAGGTAKDIDSLASVANKMGADLPLSAQDCSEAMIEMARNGASVSEIKKYFPPIAQASTAAGSDIKATAGVVQQAMNIWGDSLQSPQQAAAILVQTANASNASVEDMQQALATIGGTAKQAGMDMGTTSEAIGLLTNRGFSAAQASQDLNHAILQMLAPSKIAKEQMDKLGISFTDSQGKMKPLPQILNELNGALDGLKPDERTAALKRMFGTSGMQAIAPLMESVKNKTDDTKVSWDAYAKSQDQAASSTEAATKFLKEQADGMQQNLGAKIEQIGGNWESLRNKAMSSSSGVNSSIVDMINKTLEWSTTSDSSIAKITRGFVGLSPVIGPAITAVGSFVASINNIAKGVSGLIKAFQFARGAVSILWALLSVNPFAAVVIAITAVVTALTLFFTKTKTGQQIWANFTNFLSTAWEATKNTIINVAESISSSVSNTFNAVKDIVTNIWNGIKSLTVVVWEAIKTIVEIRIELTQKIIKTVFTAIQTLIVAVWNAIKTVTSATWNAIKAVITAVSKAIKSVITAAFNAIKSVVTTVWNAIKSITTTVWNVIKSIISSAVKGAKAVITTEFNIIKKVITTVWNAIKTVTKTVWNGIKSVVSSVANAIKSVVSRVWNSLKSITTSVWNAIKRSIEVPIQRAKNTVNLVVNSIKRFLLSLGNIDLFSAGRNVINGFLNGLIHAFENVKSFISGIGPWIQDHKGPKHYDLRLLIPAGNYIMSGLQEGLNNGFTKVKSFINDITGYIADSDFSTFDFSNWDKQIQNLNQQANKSIDSQIDQELVLNNQSAYITLSLGGRDYDTFVDDITNKQSEKNHLRRKRR